MRTDARALDMPSCWLARVKLPSYATLRKMRTESKSIAALFRIPKQCVKSKRLPPRGKRPKFCPTTFTKGAHDDNEQRANSGTDYGWQPRAGQKHGPALGRAWCRQHHHLPLGCDGSESSAGRDREQGAQGRRASAGGWRQLELRSVRRSTEGGAQRDLATQKLRLFGQQRGRRCAREL